MCRARLRTPSPIDRNNVPRAPGTRDFALYPDSEAMEAISVASGLAPPDTAALPIVGDVVNKAVEQVVTGQLSPRDAMNAAQEQAVANLRRAGTAL